VGGRAGGVCRRASFIGGLFNDLRSPHHAGGFVRPSCHGKRCLSRIRYSEENPPARCVKATQVNVSDNWLPLLQCIYLRSDSMNLVLYTDLPFGFGRQSQSLE
jgi:hypothetical protein